MAEHRAHSRRSGGGSDNFNPAGDSRLQREVDRAMGSSVALDNLFFNDAAEAMKEFKAGRWKEEDAIKVAYNLSLISNLKNYSASQAFEMIRNASVDEDEITNVSKSINKKNANKEAPHLVTNPPKNGRMRPLTHDERLEAKAMNLSAKDWYEKIGRKKDLDQNDIGLYPITAQQIYSPITGNGLQQPGQFEDNPPQEESPELIREKRIHTQLGSDTIETDNDVQPIEEGRGAPNRHSQGNLNNIEKHISYLRKELAAAERQHIEIAVIGKISGRIREALAKKPEQSSKLLNAVLFVVDNFEFMDEEKIARADTVKDNIVPEQAVSDEDIADYMRQIDEHSEAT